MVRTLLLSGFDLRSALLPDDARLLLPPIPLPGLQDFKDAATRALDEPLSGEPLAKLIRPHARVTLVIDDPTLPVPALSRDCRREMLEAVLQQLISLGVRPNRITALIANGLNRQWRGTEITDLLGPQVQSQCSVLCHDAEGPASMARIGDDPGGPIELNRAVIEADLVIHLNVVSQPLMAGLHGLVAGTAGYRTARILNAPTLFEKDATPLVPGSAFHAAHSKVGAQLSSKVKVVQLSAVLNNELWTPAISALLQSEGASGMTRPMQMWNALPSAVRHRAARLMRSSYRPIAVAFGPPEAVAPRALEVFYRQHEVTTDAPADVLVFGLPDLGPYSVRTMQNPVLAAHLGLGMVCNLFSGKPLLKPGGVVLMANPLTPSFDRRAHLPHEEFYEKVLRMEREPEAIHARFEPYFAGRPEFVANYQRRYAFHGTHPLYSWYQCTPIRKRAAKIIVAHGDPRACARMGFMPADDLEEGLSKAREVLGMESPQVSVIELPPPFFVRVR
jgi:hypothetical protein